MAFHKFNSPMTELRKRGSQIQYSAGDKVFTEIPHCNNEGYLDAGEPVTITAVLKSETSVSYDIEDQYGNKIYNIRNVV